MMEGKNFQKKFANKLKQTKSFILQQKNTRASQESDELSELKSLRDLQDDQVSRTSTPRRRKTRVTRIKNKMSNFQLSNIKQKKFQKPTQPVAPKSFVNVIKKRFAPLMERFNNTDQAAAPALEVQNAYPPLFPQLQSSWESVTPNYVSQDLHRLINRVTVKTSGGMRNVLMEPVALEERDQGVVHLAKSVCTLVDLLAHRLESESYAKEIKNKVEEMLNEVDEKTDMIDFNKTLFDSIPDFNDSKVMKILKCVHQSLVLKPYGILRTVVVKDKLTKDVRSEDGWQISITLAQEGFIQVKHVRKEQSIDFATQNQSDKLKNHWEYEWEVSMTFDFGMTEMTASRLTITNLIVSEGMDPLLENELKTIMNNGQLIVFG